jgi:hypothetical protein
MRNNVGSSGQQDDKAVPAATVASVLYGSEDNVMLGRGALFLGIAILTTLMYQTIDRDNMLPFFFLLW